MRARNATGEAGGATAGDAAPAGRDGAGVTVVYDGQCPFCTSYATMLRLREAFGRVDLVDARSDHPAAVEARAAFDLDEGMAVHLGDRWYHGADCIHVLALASGSSSTLNRMVGRLFASRRRAHLAYPFLRAGRNAALALMGRRRIAADGGERAGTPAPRPRADGTS